MKTRNPWLAAALMLALLPAMAMAQTGESGGDAAKRQQLAEARAALDAARQRVRELTAEMGGDRSMVRLHRIGGKRPMLGFVLGINEAKGVRLEAVTPEGPAARAGLRSGDVITGIDGVALTGEHAAQRIGDAQRRLGGLQDGQEVALAYERDGKAASLHLKAEALSPLAYLNGIDAPGARAFGSLDRLDIDLEKIELDVEQAMEGLGHIEGADIDIDIDHVMDGVQRQIRVIGPMLEETVRFDAWRWQGLRMAPLDADLGRYFGTQQGVLVLKADSESLGGLRSGDVIQSIDGTVVAEPRDAMRLLAKAEPGQRIAVGILRDKRTSELAFVAPEKPDMARLFQMPDPPAPPAPPVPPSAPSAADAPPPPPAPPAPPGSKRGVVI
jgi:hypothetical protein